jgi:ribosomal protein L1
MRKFLKSVGETSQQKIEEAVRAIESNSDLTSIELTVTLSCDAVDLNHEVKGTVELP